MEDFNIIHKLHLATNLIQRCKNDWNSQGKPFPLFKSPSSFPNYGTENQMAMMNHMRTSKNLQCTRASNTENKDCILYFLSKTLKHLLKHLPSKQEKANSVMKGEMIMSSPVHGSQPTRTMYSDCQGIVDGVSNIPTPCIYNSLQWGCPSRQRVVTILKKLKTNLHHIPAAILPL